LLDFNSVRLLRSWLFQLVFQLWQSGP